MATQPDAALIDLAFRLRPVFRQRFDAHVRAWGEAIRTELWRRYWQSAAFRAAYEARVDLERAAA